MAAPPVAGDSRPMPPHGLLIFPYAHVLLDQWLRSRRLSGRAGGMAFARDRAYARTLAVAVPQATPAKLERLDEVRGDEGDERHQGTSGLQYPDHRRRRPVPGSAARDHGAGRVS